MMPLNLVLLCRNSFKNILCLTNSRGNRFWTAFFRHERYTNRQARKMKPPLSDSQCTTACQEDAFAGHAE